MEDAYLDFIKARSHLKALTFNKLQRLLQSSREYTEAQNIQFELITEYFFTAEISHGRARNLTRKLLIRMQWVTLAAAQ